MRYVLAPLLAFLLAVPAVAQTPDAPSPHPRPAVDDGLAGQDGKDGADGAGPNGGEGGQRGKAGIAMGIAPVSAASGNIAITEGFARAMPTGPSNGSGYLTITNRGAEPDRLVAISSPSSREVEIHEMTMGGGTMQMRPLSGPLEIQPGKTVKLQPQGDLHLMFVGVSRPFADGSEVSLTLTFEKAGKIALKLPVLAPTARSADGAHPPASRP